MGSSYGIMGDMGRKQVIVQLSDQIVADLDAMVRTDGASRSELIRQAVANLLRDRRWRDLDRAANLAYAQQPSDPADDAFLEAAARVAFERLDRDEAAAGFGPWEPGPDGKR